jgi:hypothetical protein
MERGTQIGKQTICREEQDKRKRRSLSGRIR